MPAMTICNMTIRKLSLQLIYLEGSDPAPGGIWLAYDSGDVLKGRFAVEHADGLMLAVRYSDQRESSVYAAGDGGLCRTNFWRVYSWSEAPRLKGFFTGPV